LRKLKSTKTCQYQAKASEQGPLFKRRGGAQE
jgi:hypothetical protein